MRKLTVIGIIILFVAGLVPILWLHPGYIISNGDNIPPSLNAAKTFSSSANMWSTDYFGYASPNPAYFFDTCFAAFLGILRLSADYTQIIIQILLYMGAGFSMYLFSKTIYPEHKIAPFFAAFFYMFNFFVFNSRFNIGFAWLYTFLPLLLTLFVRIVNATYRQDKKSANVGVIFFALTSVVALSVASVNPANIALFLIALSVFVVYFLVKHRKNVLPFLVVIGKITAITIPINIWWMYPMLNTFIFSPAGLNSQVNVDSWSWTHVRASFLNLFWFNGTWGWSPEYIESNIINYYNTFVVAILSFIPFIVAGAALFFKSSKSRFNAYIMGCVLCFLFLATGLHDPIAKVLNQQLYNYISIMSMFREPASKFTLLVIPFLALLIGYSAESISNIKSLNIMLNLKSNRLNSKKILVLFSNTKLKPKLEKLKSNKIFVLLSNTKVKFRLNKLKSIKVFVLLFLAISFVISSLPLLTGFEPTSSYIQIPQYWYQATNWINSQHGNWNVLLTPLNDYYQMPYTWGYYGSDQLLERLFEKPIVSTAALDGYVANPDTVADLKQIRTSVRFNQTFEFKALLDLLNIRYIVQRNDVNNTYTGRDLESPGYMQSFFDTQPYLKLSQSFGKLDIYEYEDFKPSLYTILPSTLQKADVYINTTPFQNKVWNFSSKDDVNAWKSSNAFDQSEASLLIKQSSYPYKFENDTIQTRTELEADMWNSSGLIRVDSPRLPVAIESSFLINLTATGRNNSRVEVRIAEFSEDMTLLTYANVSTVHGDFDSFTIVNFPFEPENSSIKFFRIQFWIYLDATENRESFLLLDNISVFGSISTLNMTGLQYLNWGSIEEPNAQVLQVQNISPEKIIVKVNSTQPFVLATTQTLDRFWVAYVNGEKISPAPVYLGLKGFLINETGQFDVTILYQPQDWFNYCLTISASIVILLFVGLLYLNRKTIKASILKSGRKT